MTTTTKPGSLYKDGDRLAPEHDRSLLIDTDLS